MGSSYYTNAEQFTRNVGFTTDNQTFEEMFSDKTVAWMSAEITERLRGVSPDGRDIVVPDDTILSVMNNVYITYRPQTGDIYSRYTISQLEERTDADHIITETIEIIVDQVSTEMEVAANNYKLDIWDSVLLGDGISRHGLRQYAPLKMRENRPTPMLMNFSF